MSTLAEQIYEALLKEHARAGKLTKQRWIEIVTEMLPKKKVRKVNVLGAGLTDEQWFAALAQDPDYAGIDIPAEANRCRRWFKGRLTPSRKRILRWLANADRHAVDGSTHTHTNAPIPEPEDWSALMRDDEDDKIFCGGFWQAIPNFYQKRIARKVDAIKRAERAAR